MELLPHERILFENDHYTLTTQRVIQGADEARLISGDMLQIRRPSCAAQEGESSERLIPIPPLAAGLPDYKGEISTLRAMYRLAMHELQSTQNAAGAFTAGASWDGVWTRDIAYAILLGAPFAQPDACRASLDARIQDGYILQDTGTGGGWPISTDRVVWILAAWAYVRTTGDHEWLEQRIEVMLRTLRQDERVLSRQQGLFPGETSFLDWREQSYPDWMTPADIGASYAFGTNILHAAARRALAALLRLLGRHEEAAEFKAQATELTSTLQDLFWNRATRVYGMTRSAQGELDDRADTLATALSVLLGLAGEHAQEAMEHLPRSPFGTAAFGPCKSSQPESYHNRSIWPFAEAYVALAYAELQDQQGMSFSIAGLLRAAMLFGSNKENYHAFTGEARDTIQNSDAQLWSSAGMLGIFYHGLFGIRLDGRNLIFTPCVPAAYAGSHWLTGLRVGNMTIDVHINGYGSEICSALVNGCMSTPVIPLDGAGRLIIELELQPSEEESTPIGNHVRLVENLLEPQWDEPSFHDLSWHPVEGATAYRVYCNGRAIAQTASCSYRLTCERCCTSYSIQAINELYSSCLSEPYVTCNGKCLTRCAVERIGAHGEYAVERGQAWLYPNECTSKLFFTPLHLPAGRYDLRVVYCNGSYSLRDGDGCALRAIYVDEQEHGFIALPQQSEQGDWESSYQTAAFRITIPENEGEPSTLRTISLRYTPDCAKIGENQCLVKELLVKCVPHYN